MSNEQQEMITCECCGKRVERYNSTTVDTKNIGKKQICDDCYENRFCQICDKLDTSYNETFEKFDEQNVCSHCVQEKVDLCKKYLNGFMEYTKQFYNREKWTPYYCMADTQNIENYIKKNNNFKDIVALTAQGSGLLLDKDRRSLFFKLFTDLVGENFDDINVLSAHWNDFLVKNPEFPFWAEKVVVTGGCKRCGKKIEITCNSKSFCVLVGGEWIKDTAFNLYTRVKNDSEFKCRYCCRFCCS